MHLDTSTSPLHLMIRMAVPGAAGTMREVGLELTDLFQHGAPISFEVSQLTYDRYAPVATKVEQWWVPDAMHGASVQSLIAQAYAGVAQLRLDDSLGQRPDQLKRMAANQIRITRTTGPMDAATSWTFDAANAPAALADVVTSVAYLASTATSWAREKTSVRRGVPIWERERFGPN